VLVIIGLLVGGVLVGRDLVMAAEVRTQISQVEKLFTAVNTFKIKYNGVPGDIANAVAVGLGTSATWHNGDGDGRMNGFCTKITHDASFGGGALNKEADNVFYHLAQARLVEGSFITGYSGEGHGVPYTAAMLDERFMRPKLGAVYQPMHIFPSFFPGGNTPSDQCNQYSRPEGELRFGGNGFMVAHLGSGFSQFRGGMPHPVVRAVDSKMDDGLPLTGKVGNATIHSDDTAAHVAGPNVDGWRACQKVGANPSNRYPDDSDIVVANNFYGCAPVFLLQ
jgi:hypothetical protein